jgi:hypothetical protein
MHIPTARTTHLPFRHFLHMFHGGAEARGWERSFWDRCGKDYEDTERPTGTEHPGEAWDSGGVGPWSVSAITTPFFATYIMAYSRTSFWIMTFGVQDRLFTNARCFGFTGLGGRGGQEPADVSASRAAVEVPRRRRGRADRVGACRSRAKPCVRVRWKLRHRRGEASESVCVTNTGGGVDLIISRRWWCFRRWDR